MSFELKNTLTNMSIGKCWIKAENYTWTKYRSNDHFCQNSFWLFIMFLECPAGTMGPNCSITCPPGYHGRLCMEDCDCSQDQYCDPVSGCKQNTVRIWRHFVTANDFTTTYIRDLPGLILFWDIILNHDELATSLCFSNKNCYFFIDAIQFKK